MKISADSELSELNFAGPEDQAQIMRVVFSLSMPKELEETLEQKVSKGEVVAPAELQKTFVPAAKDVSKLVDWLKKHPDGNGKIASLGWCFGGGMALQAALDRPLAGAVVYYGNVARTADELKNLKGPVLGQFATQDQWINPAMVQGFEAEMKKAGKVLELHSYDANHAFANPTGQNYDAADARQAWDHTAAFLKLVLG